MRRREFILLLGGAVTAWPVAAHPQQAALPAPSFIDFGQPARRCRFFVEQPDIRDWRSWIEPRDIL
jgi:hypothetical protein